MAGISVSFSRVNPYNAPRLGSDFSSMEVLFLSFEEASIYNYEAEN